MLVDDAVSGEHWGLNFVKSFLLKPVARFPEQVGATDQVIDWGRCQGER
jgi:hypothetical protein